VADSGKLSRGSDTKTCHAMDQRSTNGKVNQRMKFDIGFKDITIYVAINGMINDNKVINDLIMMV
jgi:hypothetical protein